MTGPRINARRGKGSTATSGVVHVLVLHVTNSLVGEVPVVCTGPQIRVYHRGQVFRRAKRLLASAPLCRPVLFVVLLYTMTFQHSTSLDSRRSFAGTSTALPDSHCKSLSLVLCWMSDMPNPKKPTGACSLFQISPTSLSSLSGEHRFVNPRYLEQPCPSYMSASWSFNTILSRIVSQFLDAVRRRQQQKAVPEHNFKVIRSQRPRPMFSLPGFWL